MKEKSHRLGKGPRLEAKMKTVKLTIVIVRFAKSWEYKMQLVHKLVRSQMELLPRKLLKLRLESKKSNDSAKKSNLKFSSSKKGIRRSRTRSQSKFRTRRTLKVSSSTLQKNTTVVWAKSTPTFSNLFWTRTRYTGKQSQKALSRTKTASKTRLTCSLSLIQSSLRKSYSITLWPLRVQNCANCQSYLAFTKMAR